EAGTKLTHSRMLSLVPFGKLGAFWAATTPGIPPAAAAPVAAPASLRNARRSTARGGSCAIPSSRSIPLLPCATGGEMTPPAGTGVKNRISSVNDDVVPLQPLVSARRAKDVRVVVNHRDFHGPSSKVDGIPTDDCIAHVAGMIRSGERRHAIRPVRQCVGEARGCGSG